MRESLHKRPCALIAVEFTVNSPSRSERHGCEPTAFRATTDSLGLLSAPAPSSCVLEAWSQTPTSAHTYTFHPLFASPRAGLRVRQTKIFRRSEDPKERIKIQDSSHSFVFIPCFASLNLCLISLSWPSRLFLE